MAFFNSEGYSKTKRLEQETEVLRERLTKLQVENEQLTAEVRSLQDDGDKKKLEHVVRQELGYVKTNETVLLVAPSDSAKR